MPNPTRLDPDASAAAVSRALRESGMLSPSPGTPLARERIRVSMSLASAAVITVDSDAPSDHRRLTEDVTEVLIAAGYTVTPYGPSGLSLLRVDR